MSGIGSAAPGGSPFRNFVLVMGAGSVLGSFAGGRLVGIVPTTVLLPLLAVILALSAIKVWRHA